MHDSFRVLSSQPRLRGLNRRPAAQLDPGSLVLLMEYRQESGGIPHG